MGGRLRRTAVVSSFLAATLAGCGSGDEPAAPTATLGTAPPTTAAADPYAVPPVIDEAYVNRVLEALDAANGDVLRMVIQSKTIPREVLDRLDALYMGEFVQIHRDLLAADLQTGFNNVRPEPGNQKTSVSELITAESDCVFARVNRD